MVWLVLYAYGMIWYSMMWYGMVYGIWYGMARYIMVYRMERSDIVLHLYCATLYCFDISDTTAEKRTWKTIYVK